VGVRVGNGSNKDDCPGYLDSGGGFTGIDI
jgi:hypothetical protein